MEEVAAVRRAALAGVDDIEPERLHDRLAARLDDASFAPGVLTLVAEAAARDQAVDDSDADRAAGVQLIYEGLALTRRLAHDDPWTTGDRDAADLDILIADILVSRGFYLLARTGAAEAAVDVVREFGKDQTELRATGNDDLDGNLEADICELAVVAGVTAAGHEPTAALRAVGPDLASDGLPAVDTLLSGEVADRLTGHDSQAAADH
ncbi:DUF7114 family protein [Haloarcula laminariae]|uniref:DUF7114 family protein n=1 Tax=Haloarcula laminariae TaxID=2961577 RepID=UPI0021CADE43|nr:MULTISPECIES: hypothetical protein [Halomicroarcula]